MAWRREWLSYQEAREAVQRAGWKTQAEYRAHRQSVPGLPSHPAQVYADEWTDWRAFLGTAFVPLDEAMRIVRQRGWRTPTQYLNHCGEVLGLPTNPNQAYSDFPGWAAFFGREPMRRKNLDFRGSQVLARELGLQTQKEYMARARTDHRLLVQVTSDPDWQGWEAFLGVAPLSYAEAQQAVRALDITSPREYKRRHRERPGLPRLPDREYPEWTGWTNFLAKEPEKPKGQAAALLKEIEAAMRREGKTQADFAAFRGSPPESVSPYFTGRRGLLTEVGEELLEFLGVTIKLEKRGGHPYAGETSAD